MRTRTVTIDDAPAIAAIYNHAIEHTVASFWYGPRPVEEIRREIEQAPPDHPRLVAEDAATGEVIGFAHANPWNPRDGYAGVAETVVYIAEAARGRGVGTALYEDLFARLRAGGFRQAVAGVALPNAASVRLHESVGMRRVALFERIGFKNGRLIDVGYWQVDLRDDNPGETGA